MWIYRQSTGQLYHGSVPASTAGPVWIASGYAGGNIPPRFDATAKNNPDRQAERCIGPLPRGLYTIGTAYTDPHLGPWAMPLNPDPKNEMFGRSGFLIHADAIAHPGEASEGCMVFDAITRQLIAASPDRSLEVVT